MLSLIPRENIFFELLESAAKNTLFTSRLLRDLFEDYQGLEEKIKAINDAEHKGDEITAKVMQTLHKTFITPIDREDIQGLICALDEIVDSMEEVATGLHIYKIEKPTDDSISQVRVIVRCCEQIEKAVCLLKDRKKLNSIIDHCIELHRLENEGDRIYRRALEKLFDAPDDILYVIKWRDIYSILETAVNLAEDVSDHLQGVVLKNA